MPQRKEAQSMIFSIFLFINLDTRYVLSILQVVAKDTTHKSLALGATADGE